MSEEFSSVPLSAVDLASLSPASLKNEIETVVSSLEAVVSFVDKWGIFLPPQVKTGVAALDGILKLVEGIVGKLP